MSEKTETLTDARSRVVALFQQLKAEGIETIIENNYGRPPTLDFRIGNEYVELATVDWHPEWSK